MLDVLYRRIEPLLRWMGSDITHCEALAVAKASGAKGLADSFALRNHGMKMLKDVTYALELARAALLE